MKNYHTQLFLRYGALLAIFFSLVSCREADLKHHNVDWSSEADELMQQDMEDMYERYFPSDAPNNLEDENGEPVIAPWTRVLEDDVVERAISIEDDRIVFPISMKDELAHIQLMDVIVSQHLEMPFLRRVVFIEETDTELIFITRDADIGDFMISGYLNMDNAPVQEYDWSDEEQGYVLVKDTELGIESGNMGDFRQYHQPSSTTESVGYVNGVTEKRHKSSNKLSADLTMTFSGAQLSVHRKMEVEMASSGTRTMCNEFKNAQDGIVAGWIWDDEVDNVLLTLLWATKWAGATNRCHKPGGCNDVNFVHNNKQFYRITQAFADASEEFRTYVHSEHLTNRYATIYWANRNFSGDHSDYGMWKLNHYIRLKAAGAKDNKSIRKSVLDYYFQETKRLGWNKTYAQTVGYSNYGALRSYVDSTSLSQDAKDLVKAFYSLAATPHWDDLHWIQMAPVIGQKYCAGQATKFAFGAGMRMTVDHESKVDVHISSLDQSQPNKASIEWFKKAYSKTFIVWAGWVPIVLTAELGHLAELKSSLTGGVTFTLGYHKKQAGMDFYHGVDYDAGRSQKLQYHTLKDYNNGGQDNRLWFFEAPSSPPGKYQEGFYGTATPEIKASSSFFVGPRFMLRLYGIAGVGMRLGVAAKAEIGAGVQFGSQILPKCKAGTQVGIEFAGVGELKVPMCESCSVEAAVTIWDSCNSTSLPWCMNWEVDLCSSNNAAGAGRGSRLSAPGYLTAFPQNENEPAGSNDVPGMYELDALFLQRGGEKIVPVRVEGIANCTPERGTVERGCPELLWYADMNTCDPDAWADKVALIPDLSQFRVQFKEDAKPGDTLRVIRQAVRASEINDDGQRCAASGAMDFYVGVLDADGVMTTGNTPVGEGIYNTNDYHISEEHLSSIYVEPEDQYWPTSPDDATFGENVGHEPPE